METGLKFILSSILLCITATLFIAINFVYKDIFKVKYEELPEINNVEAFDDQLEYMGITETIRVSKYNSHLGFQMNYEVDKFNVSLQSNSSVYFYLLDNEDIYLRVEKLNKEEYYNSYNKGILEELNNSYKYKYKYLRNNKSYYKLTIKNFDSKDYDYLDLRFKYMSDSFDISN